MCYRSTDNITPASSMLNSTVKMKPFLVHSIVSDSTLKMKLNADLEYYRVFFFFCFCFFIRTLFNELILVII